ncbi:hypothetical protein B0H12DRAFT_1083685 [Mycena haematopus]|nr:hypothetical protein B0H12DRAFT_1083685 [Mycena haematopus]
MLHSNIPTRSPSPLKPKFPSRPLCVFEMPPTLLSGPFMPSDDFETTRLAVPCPPPKPIGLGLGYIDVGLDTQRRTNTTSRAGPSFDCEKSMASMTIGTDSIPYPAPATSPSESTPTIDEPQPEFNSLHDLDVQYPSSCSLSNLSPQSALNYSYSPPALSPSWSLNSIFSSSAFSSPEEMPLSSPNLRYSASWSSSSKLSISSSPVEAKTAFEQSRLDWTSDMAIPLADTNMFRVPTSVQDFNNDFKCTQFVHYYPDGFTSSPLFTQGADTSLGPLPIKCEDSPTPVPDSHLAFPATNYFPAVPALALWPRVSKRKALTQDVSPTKKKGKRNVEPEREIVVGTPILDAHRGITQAELKAKAVRYQQRNPGVEDFDKRWLASFSGKLTAAGEMIEEFRCYVVGCTQVNKRRDHMVVHVGSHLDQRQYKCELCSKRYRRKNELVRHERSHDGFRPFICPFCPASIKKSAFVRQDLLNRHLRSQHAPDKENDGPRKKIKLEQC